MMQLDTESSPQEDDMSQTQTPSRRRWSVRPGTDGHGKDLFEVYAATMEEARDSVTRSAEESGDLGLRDLIDGFGFTVHAMAPGAEVSWDQALTRNPWTNTLPAPDFPRFVDLPRFEITAEDIIPSAATHTFGPA